MYYRDRNVLITGGLGFIGSNLAIRLVAEGARVTIVDSSVPGCGANPFNIEPVRGDVSLLSSDIAEPQRFQAQIAAADVVFNVAGEISHVHSMGFPERDLLLNTVAQLRFLLACRELNPGLRVVYAGTRQVYGAPDYLPVDERHPIHPVDFNGIHKYAATMYHVLLAEQSALDTVVLRLTNVYGPRMALNVPCQGFLSTFLRRLLTGRPLEIYGDGNQLRDPVYVDDVVEAFLLAGQVARLPSRTFNVGGPSPLRLSDIAELTCRAAGSGQVSYRPFPEERRAIDIGSYYSDSTLLRRELGWEPGVGFQEGIARTFDYYRSRLDSYLGPEGPDPACPMPEHKGHVRHLVYASGS